MTMQLSSLIRTDATETQRLLGKRVQQSCDDFAACCLLLSHQDLMKEYHLIRRERTERRNRILTHPLFLWIVDSLLNTNRTAPDFASTITDAVNLLKVLRLDVHAPSEVVCEEWMILDEHGRLFLPHSGLVVDCGTAFAHEQVHVSVQGDTITFAGNGRGFGQLQRGQKRLLALIPDSSPPIRVWNTRAGMFFVDPFTRQYHAAKPEEWLISGLTPHSQEEWVVTLGTALSLLKGCGSQHWDTVSHLIRIIVPVQNSDTERHLSSSTATLPNVVYMSWTPDLVQVLEALVHEAGHQKLFLYESTGPLVETSDQPLLRSPWRADLRPPTGLLHGVFAFAAVLDAWNALLAWSSLPEAYRSRIASSRVKVWHEVTDGLREIRAHIGLTDMGEGIVGRIELLTQAFSEPLSSRPNNSAKPQISHSSLAESIWPHLEESDQSLFTDVCGKNPLVADLAQNTRRIIDLAFAEARFSGWLNGFAQRGLCFEFLRWCLPLGAAQK